MRPRLTKTTYSKQGTAIFAVIFAMIAILGMMSILTPDKIEEPDEVSQVITTRSNYSGYLMRVVVVTLTMMVVLRVGLRIYRKQL
ncbi:MAG: hypothetical protein L3J79_06150, partial [Candidatus Marinimicrobia bacterium]|nr:hypothetical protein [Candidatus Neomarinimicrobiota bacterium]